MLSYLPYMLISLATALAACVYARMLGFRLGCLVPRKLGRSRSSVVPYLGGLVLVLAIVPVLAAINPASRDDLLLSAGEMARQKNGVIAGTLVLFYWGFIVDIRRWTPLWCLLGQVGAILIVYAAGIRVHEFRPLGLSNLAPAVSFLITFGWLFIVINFIRFLDGIDGLPELVALVIIALHLMYGGEPGWHFMRLLGMVFLGGLAGALVFGLYPARLYLGQNGSSLPGFFVGVVSVVARQKSVLTLTFVLPTAIIFITLAIIVMRLLERQLLFRQRSIE
jgi:UDP-N-acetylmuramyl pentapeptide phosphotransferase/UDP-N-acetylglucosamine-1-phosphate transferase